MPPRVTLRATCLTAVAAMVLALVVATAPGGAAAPGPPHPAYVVKAIVSAQTVPLGHEILVRGRVAPKAPHARVDVQALDGASWRTVGQGRLTKKSTFLIGWTPTASGVYLLRAVKPAGDHHARGLSVPMTVVATGLTLPVGPSLKGNVQASVP